MPVLNEIRVNMVLTFNGQRVKTISKTHVSSLGCIGHCVFIKLKAPELHIPLVQGLLLINKKFKSLKQSHSTTCS